MDRYYARICWNTHGWRSPSGDAALLEVGTYAAKDRFGHEEWLFNFMWTFDGYHYAFLQGINNANRSKGGKTVDVLLWAIDGYRRRVYVVLEFSGRDQGGQARNRSLPLCHEGVGATLARDVAALWTFTWQPAG